MINKQAAAPIRTLALGTLAGTGIAGAGSWLYEKITGRKSNKKKNMIIGALLGAIPGALDYGLNTYRSREDIGLFNKNKNLNILDPLIHDYAGLKEKSPVFSLRMNKLVNKYGLIPSEELSYMDPDKKPEKSLDSKFK